MMSVVLPASAPAGSTKLTGSLIGTAGSYQNKGNTITNAVDGNAATYFDAPSGVVGWIGYDLGSQRTITQLQYLPRSGYASRMVGGMFQGADSADFSGNVITLSTITGAPVTNAYSKIAVNVSTPFRYVRYLSPANSAGNVAELEFDGTTTSPVVPTPPVPPAPVLPAIPSSPVNLAAAAISSSDIHLTWQQDPSSIVAGFSISRKGSTDAGYVVVGKTAGTTLTYDDLTVLAGQSYAYQITAANSSGISNASAPASATTASAAVSPWSDSDIGAVGKPGSAKLNSNGSLTISGSGADIWNQSDAFNFNAQSMVGDGSLIAQVTAESNPSSWAKSGVMMRETLNSDSRFVLLALTPSNGVTLQARTATHTTPSVSITVPGKAGVWLELVRTGSSFSGYVSTDGATWKLVGTVVIPMVNNIQAGLAVTAHNNSAICTATFSNVAITTAGSASSAWTAGATAPMARWESQSFSYNGKLYEFGGYIDRTLAATTECDAYDPATNSWSYVTSIPTGAIVHAAVTVVGDVLYIAGGNIPIPTNPRGGAVTSVLTYNLTTNTWGSIASLPTAMTSGGLVCINNQLISFGGINASNTADVNSTWTLDLNNPNASWTAAANMPNGRHHLGYAVINGLAYAIGGQHLYAQNTGNDSEVDTYNPITNTWTQIASLPFAWSGIHNTTMVINDKIVIIGGQTNGGYDGIYLNQIEQYDPSTNLWKNIGTLPEANQGQSAAYINGQLVVANGTVDNLGGWAQNQVLINTSLIL